MKFRQNPHSYVQAIPDLLKIQLVSKLINSVFIYFIHQLMTQGLLSTGHIAVSNGDYRFLFHSWQGIVLAVLVFVILLIYVCFDINVVLLFSNHRLHQQPVSLWQLIKEVKKNMPRFLSPPGILIVLYIVFLAPIVNIGMTVSLKYVLYIPAFFITLIKANPVYRTSITVFLIVSAILGFFNLFIVHGIVLDHQSPVQSAKTSFTLIKHNWKHFLLQHLRFLCAVVM